MWLNSKSTLKRLKFHIYLDQNIDYTSSGTSGNFRTMIPAFKGRSTLYWGSHLLKIEPLKRRLKFYKFKLISNTANIDIANYWRNPIFCLKSRGRSKKLKWLT